MDFLRRLASAIDAVNDRVGRAVRLLAFLMVVVTTYDVVMRYVFRQSFVFVQELEWHLFALLFLLAAGYAQLRGDHVRVDIFYARMSERNRALVDVVCGVLFLFPTCFLLIWTSLPFVQASVAVREGSPDPGGLPARYLLKAAIPVSFTLLALQGLADLVKNVERLQGRRAAR